MSTTYDILASLVPATMFRQKMSVSTANIVPDPPPTSFTSKVLSDPIEDIIGTSLHFRIDDHEVIEVVFETDPVDDVVTAIENAIADSDDAGLIEVTFDEYDDNRLRIKTINGHTIEIMQGNAILGFYETNPMRVFLKVIAPFIEDYRNSIKSINDIIDVDNAPIPFLKQIGMLLGHKWREDISVYDQRKLIKQVPFIHQIKGTIPSIQRIVRIYGGDAEIFEPYKYISRYESDAWDGERVFKKSGTRSYVNGQTLKIDNEQYFQDTTNNPFIADDEHRYIFIPNLPGPIEGHKISEVISSSLVKIPSIAIEDAIDLFYVVKDPPRIHARLESRDYWHEGVYEVISDISPDLFREEVLEEVHPSGRIAYFTFKPDIPTIEDDTEDPEYDVTRIIDISVAYGEECGASFDEEGEFEDGEWDGCQVLFGFDVETNIREHINARVHLAWSQILSWEDVSVPLFNIPNYAEGVDIQTPVYLPSGHTFLEEYTDAIPDCHEILFGFTGTLDSLGGEYLDLTGSVPVGGKILIVNNGGTVDKENDNFAGGSNLVENTDWEQVSNTLHWLTLTRPAVKIFYSYDPYNLIE